MTAVAVVLLLIIFLPVITLLTRPAAATVTPAWTAYVVNYGDSTVTPINTATDTTGAPIDLTAGQDTSDYGTDSYSTSIALNPAGTNAYVFNEGYEDVTIIGTSTNTVVGTPPNILEEYDGGFQGNLVAPDNGEVFISGSAIGGGGQQDLGLGTFRDSDDSSEGWASLGTGGTESTVLASTSDGFLYGAAEGTIDPIAAYGTEQFGRVVPLIDVGGVAAMAVTPDGSTLYALGGTQVTPVSTVTNTAGSPILLPAGVEADQSSGGEDLAISPDGSTAYLGATDHATGGGGVVVPINLASQTAGTPIPVGNDPVAIAITPDGSTAFVTNSGDNTVTPINLASQTAGTPIPVGNDPVAIAITPDEAPVAQLSVSPAPAGNPTIFDASASTVAYGNIASYAWNFGDGSTETTTTPVTTHTYSSMGSYDASVTETSSGGTSTTQVFTGSTMSRNGGPSAESTADVVLPTATTLSSSSADPSTLGKAVSLKATVYGTAGASAPTGSVNFAVAGAVDACQAKRLAAVAGTDHSTASCSFTPPLGTSDITAQYGGSATYPPSSSAVLSHLVTGTGARDLSESFSANPSAIGAPVTVTATVRDPSLATTPSGALGFTNATYDTALCQTVPLVPGADDSATASCTFAPPSSGPTGGGDLSIVATYSGDATFLLGSVKATLIVAGNDVNTTLVTFTSKLDVTLGSPVTLMASVVGDEANPTGSVIFSVGGTQACTAKLSAARASCKYTPTALGTTSVTFTYSGDATYAAAGPSLGYPLVVLS